MLSFQVAGDDSEEGLMTFWLPDTNSVNGVTKEEEEDEEDLMNALSSHLLTTDILPLVLNGEEVSLAHHPTDSTLPVSPIFICSNEEEDSKDDTNETKQVKLLPPDLASCEATVDVVQDLDALLNTVESSEDATASTSGLELPLDSVGSDVLSMASPLSVDLSDGSQVRKEFGI